MVKVIKFFIAFIITFFFFIVLGYILTDKIFLPIFVGAYKEDVKVPNLIGMNYKEADSLLSSLGLSLKIESRDYSSEYGMDTIISQNPIEGKYVKKGRFIRVVVSKGGQTITVPYLHGLSQKEAIIRLRKYGLEVGNIIYVDNDSLEKDIVVDSKPPYGSVVLRGSPIDLELSKGLGSMVIVPNFVGIDINTAIMQCKSLGLSVGSITRVVADSVLPETIIQQSVPPKTKLPKGSSINFVVSTIE